MILRSKLPEVGTTIFTVMSRMAADFGAINLSQGYPDFSVPEPLLEALHRYSIAGHNQYPPMRGLGYLREQVSAKLLRCYGVACDPESEITVTSGATEALFVAIQTIVNNGDEVIVFDPAYDAYDPAVTLAGGQTIHVPMQNGDNGFCIDWARVASAITKKTRAIIINSPHNPTGSVFCQDDVIELVRLIKDTAIMVISDEVYEHMVFDGDQHLSIVAVDELRDRSFVISSFGKTYHATGWKVGYCVAPPALTDEFRKIHQFVTFTTHTPTQWAIADYLEHHPEHDQNLPAFYQAKRDHFLNAMQGIGFEMTASAGTYFQIADYKALSPLADVEFANHLTQQAGVAVIPLSPFYQQSPGDSLIRFCFAKQDATLSEAAEKLEQFFESSKV